MRPWLTVARMKRTLTAAREDDDDDDGPLRAIRRLSRFSLELIHVTVFFYGSPSGKLQMHSATSAIHNCLNFIIHYLCIRRMLLLLFINVFRDRIYLLFS